MLLTKILALTLPVVALAAPVAEPAPLKDADLVGVSASDPLWPRAFLKDF